MINKKELRKQAKLIRSSLDIEAISEKIIENIRSFDLYQTAKHIMIFYPISHEVNLLELLNDNDKSFYLPKVKGEKLLVCPYENGDELKLSSFKTNEPISLAINPEILELIFVPALLVDEHNHRLGYGGGFYDKFLAKNSFSATKIVAIPDAQVVKKLPSESFDARIDFIITETMR